MPPVTRRPLSSISANIQHNAPQSPKPLDCCAIKRSFNSPSKSPIIVLNATPVAQVRNEVAWHISDLQAQTSKLPCHAFAPIFKSAWSESPTSSQSLSALIPGLMSQNLRHRVRALMTICAAGQLLQRQSVSNLSCIEERRKVDDQNAQADATLRSFELDGGCAAIVALLQCGRETEECGALMALALLCAAGPARFCARVCQEGGLSKSILILKRPWGEKCSNNVLGLLLNCSSHNSCHSSFCEGNVCAVLLNFCVPQSKEKKFQLLTNYACSAFANLFGGSSSTRNTIINPPCLDRIFLLAKQGCSAAALAVKNLCCSSSSTDCANLHITGSDLLLLVQHLLPGFTDCAEIACSALQSYCLHSALQPQHLRALVDVLPRAGILSGSLLAILCNATLHRE